MTKINQIIEILTHKAFKEKQNFLELTNDDLAKIHDQVGYKNKQRIDEKTKSLFILKSLKTIIPFVSHHQYNSSDKKYYVTLVLHNTSYNPDLKMILKNKHIPLDVPFVTLNSKVPFKYTTVREKRQSVRITDGCIYTLKDDDYSLSTSKEEFQKVLQYQRNINREAFGSIRMTSNVTSVE